MIKNGIHSTHSSPLQREDPSVEASRVLPRTLALIQSFIESGEDVSTFVSPWGSIPELRDAIKLDLPDSPKLDSDDDLLAAVKLVLDNSVNPWTGRFLDKLYAAPTPTGIAADMVLSAVNANAHVMSASPMLSLAEERCVEGLCDLFGFRQSRPDGLTMPGGSSANTLAVQTALANIFPPFRTDGLIGVTSHLASAGRPTRPLLFTSSQCHYSLDKAAISAGLGLASIVKVACDHAGRMSPNALQEALDDALQNNCGTPFFINATSGTTVLGSFDPLPELSALARKYQCWLHIDASWGGPVIFSSKHRSLMAGSDKADSITINPHKLLSVPLQCSFLLVRDAKALSANSLDAGYLFHSKDSRENAAMKTMGCGRRGDALKFWLYWIKYGRSGLGKHVEVGFELANELVTYIKAKPGLELGPLAEPLFLQICFRPLPLDADAQRRASIKTKSAATHFVYEQLKRRRMFAVDFAPLPNDIGDFIRLVVHPRTKPQDLRILVDQIADIGQDYWRQQSKLLS